MGITETGPENDIPVFAKKKPQRARIFREIFAKFSQQFQKFSEVFGSVWKFFEVFGRIRMRLDAFERFVAEENAEKTKQTFGKKTCIFTMFLRSCVKNELATPHTTHRKKTKKTKYVSNESSGHDD